MKTMILLVITLALFWGCGKRETIQEQEQQTRLVPVMIETVTIRSLDYFIPITGRAEGIVDMTLSSETNGKITQLYKSLGDKVEKGEELGKIDNQAYSIQLEQSKAGVLAAEAAYKLAEITWETNDRLYKNSQVSKMEWIQAESSFLNAKAGLQSAKANLERAQKAYDNSMLIIPVSGYIADLSARVGEYIAPGMPLASIVNIEQLIIKTGVAERHVLRLQKGQTVTVTDFNSNQNRKAKISGIGKKIMPGTATYPVEMILNNTEQTLLPGMLVQMQILSHTYEDAIYTMLNYVIKQYDDHFVFVIDEENIAHKRKVTLGEEVADYVIVKTGLEEGDRLVIEGMANLENGSSVEIRARAE